MSADDWNTDANYPDELDACVRLFFAAADSSSRKHGAEVELLRSETSEPT
jgi:hypothetical protein